MAPEIAHADSTDAVDTSHLLAVFPPDTSKDPVSQSILDVVSAVLVSVKDEIPPFLDANEVSGVNVLQFALADVPAYFDGLAVRVVVEAVNTAALQARINALTNHPVYYSDGETPVAARDLMPGRLETFTFINRSGITPRWVLGSPPKDPARGVLFVKASEVQGSANAISLQPTGNLPAAYTESLRYAFRVEATNTAAVTARVGNLAALAVVKSDGTAFASGELEIGDIVTFAYDAINNRFVSDVHSAAVAPATPDNSIAASKARADSAAEKKEWLDRFQAGPRPSVVSVSTNYDVTAADLGRTIRITGTQERIIFLPSVAGAIEPGFEIVARNDSTRNQSVRPNGSDKIGGVAGITIFPGQGVRIQAIASGLWAVIADTAKGTGGGADIPDVIQTNSDGQISETDHGKTYIIAGNNSLQISLPNPSNVDLGYFVRIGNNSATVTHYIKVNSIGDTIQGSGDDLQLAPYEVITVQKVGARAWRVITDTTRSGTDSTARAAAAAARAAAAAAQTAADGKISRDDLPPFASIYAVPQGIDGRDFPTPFEIFFSERLTAKTITRLVVNAVGSIAQIDATTPLSGISSRARDSGALRFSLNSQAIQNIRNAIGANDVARAIQLTFTFNDGTSYLHTIPFPVNNSVFAPPSPRVQTVTPTATAVVLNYSSGAAVQLNMNRNVALNLGGGVHGQSMLVQCVQDGTGNRTLTLNAAIQRDGRAAPVLSTSARARDFLYFYRDAASWVYLGIIKAA